MEEIAPGLWHWTARHPHIGSSVSSYYLEDAGVLIDPLFPPEGPDWFIQRDGAPRHIVLSNRHHDRDSWRLHEIFGCEVHCIGNGLHELDFDRLLLAHGDPVLNGARADLHSFLEGAG